MRICFFGHADYSYSKEIEWRLFSILEHYSKENDVEFLFGGYGRFDDLAYECVKSLDTPNKITKTFVTPYITESYLKNQLEYHQSRYDGIIYPEIESVPLKFAITARNKWMIDRCDLVIAYVNRGFGGAYSALKYAKNRNKKVVNLGQT